MAGKKEKKIDLNHLEPEEKLKYGQFQAAGQILKEASSLAEKIKQQEKRKTR